MHISLEELLFSQPKQQELILLLATELESLSGTRRADWLGNQIPLENPQRKRPIQQTCADVLGARRREAFESARTIDFAPTATALRTLAVSGNGLDTTFVALLALLVCDNLVDIVARSTPRRVCDEYFTAGGGFEARITARLTGRMGYSGVSGTVLESADPSYITAVREMLLLKRIISPTGA